MTIASQKYADTHFQIRKSGKFQSIYGEVGKLYAKHLGHFKEMMKRSRKFNRECDFDRSASGFLLFVEHIGPYPEDMIRPTVGRKDHSKGYVYGNFEWQTLEENNREQVGRNNFRLGDPEVKAKWRERHLKGVRSRSMKGCL